jgi:DNA-binding NtrC family response regulator
MAQIIPFPARTHVLIVEDDWVIREVLREHFLRKSACRLSLFNDLGQALYYLHLDCQARVILSNFNLDGHEGVSLSSPHLWQRECEVVLTTGYSTEADRFRAFDAGRDPYRVQPMQFDTLCRLVRVDRQISSYQ